ncbi:MAG TPA: FGGY-family carbohydrate kinase [Terriglobales bacterium]|nr:FGGY-family carbohydrate kinase [Terriglobales bacterium]
MSTQAHVAVDLGAESCRVSLLRWSNGIPEIRLVHRFPNSPISERGGLRWDLENILLGVEKGLRLCANIAEEGIAAVGVDGWAVDYVRLMPDGKIAGNPFCYRDERTIAAEKEVRQRILPDRLYALTGIQLLSLNTLYQLYADGPSATDQSAKWLNLPEFITYRLGGKPVAEYTNATHTQLVSLGTHEWCEEIFKAAGLDLSAAPEIVPTGSVVGAMEGKLAGRPAFKNTKLIVPACHDTASAIAGISADGDDWAFISSGTWSLVGTLLDSPCMHDAARSKNFTNLGGAGGKICFLKNVNGMWLLRQCLQHWESRGWKCDIAELIKECETLPAPDYCFDVDAPGLLSSGDMPNKINAQRQHAGYQPFPEGDQGIALMVNSIFHSLALRYASVLNDIADATKKKMTRLYIVGGGSKNDYLNRLTAERTGLEVLVGSSESSTVGNFAIQLAALRGDMTAAGVKHSSVAQWAGVLGAQPVICSLEGAAR